MIYFHLFKQCFYEKNCVGFSGIQTQIDGVEGEHVDHLSHYFCAFFERKTCLEVPTYWFLDYEKETE